MAGNDKETKSSEDQKIQTWKIGEATITWTEDEMDISLEEVSIIFSKAERRLLFQKMSGQYRD